MKLRSFLTLTSLGLSVLIVSGCGQAAVPTATPAPIAEDVLMNIVIEPDPPTVGDAALIITLVDDAGQSVEAKTISVRGDMTHAGMVPVTGETTENAGASGTFSYRIPLNWSMGGDWIVTVDATLADGRKVIQEYNITVASS